MSSFISYGHGYCTHKLYIIISVDLSIERHVMATNMYRWAILIQAKWACL